MQEQLRSGVAGFIQFVREHGVIGLAIAFVLGGGVQKVVTALVADIITPAIGLVAGRVDGLKSFALGPFLIGDFVSVLIDFVIIAAVIYFVFRGLGLEKLDTPKEK